MEPGEKKVSLHKLQKQYDLSRKDLDILEKEEGLERYETTSGKSRWFLSEVREAAERRKARLRQEAKLQRWDNGTGHVAECKKEIKRNKADPRVKQIGDRIEREIKHPKKCKEKERTGWNRECWDAM